MRQCKCPSTYGTATPTTPNRSITSGPGHAHAHPANPIRHLRDSREAGKMEMPRHSHGRTLVHMLAPLHGLSLSSLVTIKIWSDDSCYGQILPASRLAGRLRFVLNPLPFASVTRGALVPSRHPRFALPYAYAHLRWARHRPPRRCLVQFLRCSVCTSDTELCTERLWDCLSTPVTELAGHVRERAAWRPPVELGAGLEAWLG